MILLRTLKVLSVALLFTTLVSSEAFGMHKTSTKKAISKAGKKSAGKSKKKKQVKKIKKDEKKVAETVDRDKNRKGLKSLVDLHVSDRNPIKLVDGLENIFKFLKIDDEEILDTIAEELAEILKKRHINVNVVDMLHQIALHIAVRKAASKDGFGLYIVKTLYLAGSNKNKENYRKETPLSLAANPKVLEILMNDKDDFYAQNMKRKASTK